LKQEQKEAAFKERGLYRLRRDPSWQGFVKGHDFSRADKANQINRALAPEENSKEHSRQISRFSAACSAAPLNFQNKPHLANREKERRILHCEIRPRQIPSIDFPEH